MAVNIPHYLTFPALSSLPSNSFRVRKVTHWASNRELMALGNQRRININAPPNWYMLGQHSYVEFNARCNGKNRENWDDDENENLPEGEAIFDTRSRIRAKWGAGAPFARVRETLNAGSFCIDGVDDPELTGPILAQRGWCTRRSQFKANATACLTSTFDIGPGGPPAQPQRGGVLNGTYGRYEVIDSDSAGGVIDENVYGISTLENAGYAPISARSVVTFPVQGQLNNFKKGFAYSVPLSAYSRLATKEFIPVGF